MKREEMFKILDKYKQHIGFADWKIVLSAKYSDLGSNFAEVGTDMYEKILTIDLSKKLIKEHSHMIENVLIHELVHARVRLFKSRYEAIKDQEEELMVNDIVRMAVELAK